MQQTKLPPNAFWNNMTVSTIPAELECLSEMEIRLISRIEPFLKVVRLGCRFGQQGFKGQAVLFSQQLEEIAEQLPISITSAGIIIVSETLQNVVNKKRYLIDITKIKRALQWLVLNNHFYSNVPVSMFLKQSYRKLILPRYLENKMPSSQLAMKRVFCKVPSIKEVKDLTRTQEYVNVLQMQLQLLHILQLNI